MKNKTAVFFFLSFLLSCSSAKPSYVIGVQSNFIVKVDVISVYDGDTFRGDLHLGMGIVLKNQPFRLAEINAPELYNDGGRESQEFLFNLIYDEEIYVEIVDEREKYGRILALIYDKYEICGENKSINHLMVEKGFAEIY